jgi:hypothetical protein
VSVPGRQKGTPLARIDGAKIRRATLLLPVPACGSPAPPMRALTDDPDDRDGLLFLQHLRDSAYRRLIDTARDTLAPGVSVLAVAPLSREVREQRLSDRDRLDVGDDWRLVWCGLRPTRTLRKDGSPRATIPPMHTSLHMGTNTGSAASRGAS